MKLGIASLYLFFDHSALLFDDRFAPASSLLRLKTGPPCCAVKPLNMEKVYLSVHVAQVCSCSSGNSKHAIHNIYKFDQKLDSNPHARALPTWAILIVLILGYLSQFRSSYATDVAEFFFVRDQMCDALLYFVVKPDLFHFDLPRQDPLIRPTKSEG